MQNHDDFNRLIPGRGKRKKLFCCTTNESGFINDQLFVLIILAGKVTL